jgi:hypothetical protein
MSSEDDLISVAGTSLLLWIGRLIKTDRASQKNSKIAIFVDSPFAPTYCWECFPLPK